MKSTLFRLGSALALVLALNTGAARAATADGILTNVVATAQEKRLRVFKRFFNPEALERAINAYAAKHPAAYADKDALLAELRALAADFEKVRTLAAFRFGPDAPPPADLSALDAWAARLDAFHRKVYLRHPALDFKDILCVRRAVARPQTPIRYVGGFRIRTTVMENRYKGMGLPQNWDGNSSIPVTGYSNDIRRVALADPLASPGRVLVSTRGASSAFLGDVKLDYDATRVMYSSADPGRKNWRVYETALDGSAPPRAVTPDIDDIDYYDACWLPDDRRLFVATSGFQGVPCVNGTSKVGNLHIMEKDGKIRRLVFDQDNSWCPTVLDNGRILYLRWEYTDSAHYFARVIMTMNPDGTDQQEFYGSNSYWPNSTFFTRAMPGSVTRFCGIVTGHHGVPRMGRLVVFDVSKGRRETDGAVQTVPGWNRPVENLTQDQLVKDVSPLLVHPWPLDDDLFLVSALDPALDSPAMIAFADIYDNIIPLWYSDSEHLFEPVPVRPSRRPVLPIDRRRADDPEAAVYMTNVRVGPGLAGVPAGKAKKLRLFQYDYSPRMFGGHYFIGMDGPWDKRVTLGTVDLEPDGSCYFKIPANTPISVQPLDENGQAMQIMRSWLVGMPGETLSCIGCHEDQNAAVSHTAARPAAIAKPPRQITPWHGPRRNFSFEREVQPVLDAKCAGCHNPDTKRRTKLGAPLPDFATTALKAAPRKSEAGVYSVSYANLHPYVRRNGPEGDYHVLTPMEFHVDTSPLFQLLKKGHHGVVLSDEEMDRLVTWADLNVPCWGTWKENIAAVKKEHPKKWHARESDAFYANNHKRRQEMAKEYANDTFDSEVIVNPYQKAAFVPPAPEPKPAPAPRIDGWPFDAAEARFMRQDEPMKSVYKLDKFHEIRFARIPAGSFAMGSNDETPAERPVHKVTIPRGFWMADREISLELYCLFDPEYENGYYDQHNKDQVRRGYNMDADPRVPVIRVSWEQANAFCAWLSQRIGRKVQLPTEAQWEWACRAGSATPLNYGGLNDNFGTRENLADATMKLLAVRGVDPKPIADPCEFEDYEKKDARFNDGVLHLAPVASYRPNAWGLHDMHGNVAEWTRTAWRPYPSAPGDGRDDPSAQGDLKVVRGGSWYRRPQMATSSWRWRYPKWMRPFDVGFRVVIED